MKLAKKLIQEEEGQALTEYGLIIGLIAVGVIGGVSLLGSQISALFGKLTDALKTAAS